MSNIPKIGEIFDGKYKLEQILGSGGNGTVFRALQIEFNRNIALKILHDDISADEEYRARFLREAKALSQLSHSNVVAVYHLGLAAYAGQKMPYLVMEYVNGQSLRETMNLVGTMPVIQSMKIIRNAARAMSYVHKQGIVHRDLKPENILLVQAPDADTVKLVDFGLSKIFNPQDQKLTSTGELIGTSQYMSPEQCMGNAIDSRTDVYSLTACLYEMIVGQKPFHADSAVGFMYKHMNDPVQAIKPDQVDQFHPTLNEIVSKGMAKKPQERFESMDEMADQIDKSIGLLQSSKSDLRASSDRKHLNIALISLGILLICGTIFAMNMFRNQKKTTPDSDTFSATNANDKLEIALKKQLERTERVHGRNHLEVQKSLNALANYQISKQRYADAERLLKHSISITEIDATSESPELPKSLLYLAGSYRTQKKFSEAEAIYKRALRITEKKTSKSISAVRDQALVNLAAVYIEQGKYALADPLLKRFLQSQAKEKVRSPHLAYYIDSLAASYTAQKKYAEAEQLLKRDSQIVEKLYGADSREFAENLFHLARTYFSEQKYAEAEPLLERNLQLTEKLHEAGSPGYSTSVYLLATIYGAHKKYAEAEPLLTSYVETSKKLYGSDSPEYVSSLTSLAKNLTEQGKTDESAQLWKRIQSIKPKKTRLPQQP